MSPVATAEPEARRSVEFRWVALVFFGIFVTGFVIAWLLHQTFVAAERVAARHVPPDASGALRVDLEKVVLFAPVRESLMPLLDELGAPPGIKLEPRWQRVAAHSKLVLGRDTREAVVTWGPAPGDWALVMAGNYPDGVLSAVAEALREEGKPWRLAGDELLSPTGIAVGQAQDRALVLASSDARLRAALPASEQHDRLGIPLKGAFSFSAEPAALGWLSQALRPLGAVVHVSARADWSSPFVVNVELEYQSPPPPDAEQRVLALWSELLGADEAKRLEGAVGRPSVERRASSLSIRTRWDHIALERLAERIARHLASEGG